VRLLAGGDLTHRVDLYKRNTEGVGYVPDAPAWMLVVSCRPARIRELSGREDEIAGRMEEGRSVEITLRMEGALKAMDSGWRLKNARTGRLYNIRSVSDVTAQDRMITLLCEYGTED
jgi:head-tail adaptor